MDRKNSSASLHTFVSVSHKKKLQLERERERMKDLNVLTTKNDRDRNIEKHAS